MDMTKDIGAGGHGLPYRWRPMNFEVDGKTYLNERATATQQTGFWLCGQARKDKVGILWFGMDDAATSCLTPIYCNTTSVPECMVEGNGSMLDYSDSSAFWLFNRVTNFAYLRYDLMSKDIRTVRRNIQQCSEFRYYRRGIYGHRRRYLIVRPSACLSHGDF